MEKRRQLMELNGNGKAMNLPGKYQHKETGRIVELDVTPDIGTPMIDAFIQAGYVRVEGDVAETPVVKVEEKPLEPTVETKEVSPEPKAKK